MNTSESEESRSGLAGKAENEFPDLEAEDAELMEAIKGAVQTIHPDAHFASQLEAELTGAVKPAAPARRAQPTGRLRTWASAAAWVVLAVALMAGLGWAVQNLRTGALQPGSAMQGGGQTAVAPATSGPETEPTANNPAAEPTPTALPTPPAELPIEALAYTSPYFPQDLLLVQVSAPVANAQSSVYRIADPVPPSLESVRALAEKLGVANAGVFRSGPPGSPTALFVASNGQQRLTFYYTNSASFDYIADYQHFGAQSLSVPPGDELVASAERFLLGHGLLDFPYTAQAVENWPGRVRFTRLVDGLPLLAENSMVVNIDENGAVRQVTYNPPVLEKLGDFPIRSAAEAWQIVLDGENQLGLAISGHSEVPFTLQTWMRAYQPGERVEMFGILEILLPADGGQAQVFLNNYQLVGSTEALAQNAGSETFVQLWGQAEQAGSSTVIRVEGWQTTTFRPEVLQGPVRWEGETAFLEVDGQAYRLPGLPTDAPGRQPAVVYGILLPQPSDGGSPMIDWITLSSGEAGGGGGGGSPQFAPLNLSAVPAGSPAEAAWPPGQSLAPADFSGGRRLTVTSIELVYWVPSPVYSPWAEETGAAEKFIQPVWRFAGQADDGSSFAILVQALAEEFLAK